MDGNPTFVTNRYARKRQKNPANWKKNIAKRNRYSAKSLPTRVCEHDQPAFQCSKITMNDMQYLHKKFYAYSDKKSQDCVILKLCSINPIRKRTTERVCKQTSIKYAVFVKKNKIPICQKLFLNIFGITKHRVNYVMKRFYYAGDISFETRGGYRDSQKRKYSEQKESVHKFIQSLKCIDSHYCRKNKIAERKYLPAELNIKKIYNMYKTSEWAIPDVKLSYFRDIFNNFYNLGFGSPRTDVCSSCLEFTEKIRNENDISKKNLLITLRRVHKLRANAFFDKLREQRDGLKIISFDCQKNLPLPNLPDQITYYSRQLYFYNLTMVEGSSKQPMSKENIFAYCCTEDEFHKDSNLVASAVYHRLTETDKTGINTIRLVADGCGGQNKNCIVIAACCKWLLTCSTVKTIEVVFPVTGHSYMPPDRAFGVIEKKLKKREVTLHPDEIKEVITETSNIVRFGDDCPVRNWREAVRLIVKPTTAWNVQFKECKRFVLRRSKKIGNVLVKGELFYKSDTGTAFNICKNKKTISMIDARLLPKIVPLNKNKIKDVNNLLCKHFGNNWKDVPSLEFYCELMRTQEALHYTPPPEGDIYCEEPLDEANELRV